MSFSGRIKEESYDPFYKVEFSYRNEDVKIDMGYAEIVRQQPKLKITYDPVTEEILKTVDCTKLEYELANLVLQHFIKRY